MPAPQKDQHDAYLERLMEAGIKQTIGIGREVAGQRKDGSTFPMRVAVGAFWHGGQKWFTGIAHN